MTNTIKQRRALGPFSLAFLTVAVLSFTGCASTQSPAGGGAERASSSPGKTSTLPVPKGATAVAVTGPTGNALEGAEVWLVDPRTVSPERAVIASRTLGDWVEASRAMAAEVAVTDAQGGAVFQGPHPEGFLVAARTGPLFGMLERREATGRAERVPLNLVARRSYPVVILQADGSPAAGLQITLAAPDPAVPDRPFLLPSTAVTNARGEATLLEPPQAATSVLEGLDQIPERLAVLRLPALEVAPLALRDDGEAVTYTLPPLASVQLVGRHKAYSMDHWAGLAQVFPAADGSRSARTLAQPFVNGEVVLPHISGEEDMRVVFVVSEASAPERFIGTMTMEFDAQDTGGSGPRRVELPLDSGLILSGRCVDQKGAALANATVDLFVVGDANASWTLVTDDEGRFRWLLLRPGKPLAKIVIGARSKGTSGELRGTTRLGEVDAGDVVDLGVFTLK